LYLVFPSQNGCLESLDPVKNKWEKGTAKRN